MAEAGIESFGVVIGLGIAFAVACITIRGKGHHDKIPFVPPGETESK